MWRLPSLGRRAQWCSILNVTPGLDPGVHEAVRQLQPYGFALLKGPMDCRVKPGNDKRECATRQQGANYAFHKLLNCVATTSSYLPTPLVMPTVCTNLHMLSNAPLEIAGS